MIPHRQLAEANDWKSQLGDAVTSTRELLALLGLEQDTTDSLSLCTDFPLLVPRGFIARMAYGDPADPLLRQVLPVNAEQRPQAGYLEDPVNETGSANSHPGIIRKYRGRVLLLLASGCAVNCRYCFRRHFPYGANQNSGAEWMTALETIADDESISEVILSGGDPLLVPDQRLADLVTSISKIPHVRRLRIHTRLPIVIPERVTPELLLALSEPCLQTTVVLHSNHANEICDGVRDSSALLRKHGITVLNQAVLLAGVNDSIEALVNLSERLFEAGILPYYLHLLDRVQGAAHFDVPQQQAQLLLGRASAELPGYLVPRLVRESAGEVSKTVIPPIYPSAKATDG